ncbi:MAG: hypothetical protein LBS28_04990 [Streptococcaceae bacterium]|jgi:hypothetical protein|nr:hypothetical protein [Streptococcaceae bacterium]
MKNLQKIRKSLVLKSCFIFTLFVASVFVLFTGASLFHLAANCPWIPGWIFDMLNKASSAAGVIGIAATLIAAGGIGAAVAPIAINYVKKHGLKLGLTL